MDDFKFKLGAEVRSTDGGFSGVIVGRVCYETGCRMYLLVQRGDITDESDFDNVVVGRIEYVCGCGPKMPSATFDNCWLTEDALELMA